MSESSLHTTQVWADGAESDAVEDWQPVQVTFDMADVLYYREQNYKVSGTMIVLVGEVAFTITDDIHDFDARYKRWHASGVGFPLWTRQ